MVGRIGDTTDVARGFLGDVVESFREGCPRKSDQCYVGESEAESVGWQQTGCQKGVRYRSLKWVVVRVHVTSSSIEEGIIDAADFKLLQYFLGLENQ